MKLLTLLIFTGIMQLHAEVYSQHIFNLNESDITVKEMFKKIEKDGRFTVFYRQDQVDLDQKVKVYAQNGTIEAVMSQVLQHQPLTFDIIDNIVVVKSLQKSNARDRVISGTVTDEQGEPLPGASVLIKGTSNGTATDVSGRFSITAAGNGEVTLVVTYLGFARQEVRVSPTESSVQIRLQPDAAALNEIVVIGYGAVKKRDLTGSVYSVKSEDIVQSPTHNAVEAIQGRVPGVDITRSSGAAGAGANINIRGNKSITSRDKMADRNAPLYIIDGFQGGDISNLNPNDIASIEVLKDASATAIYGAQGANGVIIVTTKKGAEGKTQISYNGYFGVNDFTFPQARIGQNYINLRREAYRADGQWSSAADDPNIFPDPGEWDAVQAGQWVDWVDAVTRNGTQQSHSVSLTSGSEKTKVFASAGYFRESGMFRNNDYNRYNIRLNLDQNIGKWVKAGILSQVTYVNQDNRRDPLSQAETISPLGVPYNENGEVNIYPIEANPDKISPLADERTRFVARDNNIRTAITTNAYVELQPLEGLTFRSNFGANLNFNRRGIYNDATSLAQSGTKISMASSESNFGRFFNWDNILTYNKDISGHSFTLTGITSYIQSDVDQVYASGTGQILASQLFYDLSSTGADNRTIRSPYVGWKNMAYAGRVNYSYKGKYLFTASGRYDGASRLAEGNKWDFFPSVAAGWNISEENFMKDVRTVSNLKLRASYGVSGNYSIDPYGTQSGLVSGTNMSFGEVPAPMYQFKTTIGNPNLGWEKSATTNLGLDLGLFKNKVSATLDLYKTVTSDILLLRTLPQSSGVANVYQNIGETQNKGIELAITSQNVRSSDFTWTTTFTFAHNKEAITKLVDGNDILVNERESLLLGKPINSFYTYRKLGIWQLDEADEAASYRFNSATGNTFKPGDIKLADLNGDNIIDADNDRTYIGSTVPDWLGGLQNTFTYKGFDLGVFLFARYGQMLDAEFLGRYNPSGEGNGPAIIDYWTPENPTNDFPRPMRGSPLNNYAGYQTLNFVDGSYFKIKNITLGYTLPKAVAGKILADNVRIYATGSNVLTVAKSHLVKDYDPERGGAESGPLSKQFVFGINVGF